MTGLACYLERSAEGVLIDRARVLSAGFEQQWTGAASNEPDAAVAGVRSCALWIADQLGRAPKILDILCADPDGAMCVWLSSPSTDPSVIGATMMQARSDGPDSEAGAASNTPSGLLGAASAGFGTERSIQALAADLAAIGSDPAARAQAIRRRFAVLSAADAPLRLIVDELDQQNVVVGTVCTIWHAMAAAWDPGSPLMAGRALEPEADRPSVAANNSPCTAVVLFDPLGRLIWCWCRAGEVLTAGTLRLSTQSGPPPAPVADAIAPAADDARRIAPPPTLPLARLACRAEDVARLSMDWLAWSLQLGECPTQIVCVGPELLCEGGDAPEPAAAAIGRAWHGASTDAVVVPDPIAATLTRLLRPGSETAIRPEDPRQALVALTHRRGRVHRRYMQWLALVPVGLALVAGAAGWRLRSESSRAGEVVTTLKAQMKEQFATVEEVIPGISEHVDPIAMLRVWIENSKKQQNKITPERPMLAEVLRIIDACESASDVKLTNLNISNTSGNVELEGRDAEFGQLIDQQLLKLDGEMSWSGASRPNSQDQTKRLWILTGTWPARHFTPPPTGGKPGGA